jgi:predicted nucleic acid-binding protein
MILLDTNVLSELMRPESDQAVLRWMADQSAAALHVTSISFAEILFGIEVMPEGKRRRALAEQAMAMFTEDFAGRILSFDPAAASAYAAIAGQRRLAGSSIQPVDAMIVAIARTHGAAIATRDRALQGCGVPVVSPWMGS